ncbi:TatD family hydrolase [Jeotgalibacillus soli]|uniref:DNAase n=1 Tax=Jeotgalibacillus soli TaxID=889306 RepID=A0A0C2W5J2_9BACL|nr:TatD family hydrolase [Jeotgalibacillus soli]KIL51851.1 hypothetical protein KP78_02210 [Jeotgalibacillus soli]
MNGSIIDAHLHLDLYSEVERKILLQDLKKYEIEALISVSNNLSSAKKNVELAQIDQRVYAAFGFHPEQALPSEIEIDQLLSFIKNNTNNMIAIGEVGLPYYLRREKPEIPIEPYLEMLEVFIQLTANLNKPVILHAVYEDAPVVCELLEKYSIKKAHFHWFKGSSVSVQHLMQNGYYISLTPDCLYKPSIQQMIKEYPLTNMMVETDGPWPFEGPFKGRMTHPKMIRHSIAKIAELKRIDLKDAYQELYRNTKEFYQL